MSDDIGDAAVVIEQQQVRQMATTQRPGPHQGSLVNAIERRVPALLVELAIPAA